jgi:hypothetical protein
MVVVPPMTNFIGSTKYMTCKGGSSNTYSFGQIVSAGGTLKAVITNPSTENVTVEACTSVPVSRAVIRELEETN